MTHTAASLLLILLQLPALVWETAVFLKLPIIIIIINSNDRSLLHKPNYKTSTVITAVFTDTTLIQMHNHHWEQPKSVTSRACTEDITNPSHCTYSRQLQENRHRFKGETQKYSTACECTCVVHFQRIKLSNKQQNEFRQYKKMIIQNSRSSVGQKLTSSHNVFASVCIQIGLNSLEHVSWSSKYLAQPLWSGGASSQRRVDPRETLASAFI